MVLGHYATFSSVSVRLSASVSVSQHSSASPVFAVSQSHSRFNVVYVIFARGRCMAWGTVKMYDCNDNNYYPRVLGGTYMYLPTSSPHFEYMGPAIRPNVHRNSEGVMGWLGRNCLGGGIMSYFCFLYKYLRISVDKSFSFWGSHPPDPLPELRPQTPLGDFGPPDTLPTLRKS